MLISSRQYVTAPKGTVTTACLFVLFIGLVSCAEKKKVDPGIPLELAIERKQSISNLRYDLYFDLPEWATEDINAKATVTFDLANKASLLLLDFNAPAGNIKSILVNKKAISIVHENEHVVIEKKSLADGLNTVEIEFPVYPFCPQSCLHVFSRI
jgi:aminopeptidase N